MEFHVFSNLGATIESSLIAPAQKIAMALSGALIPFVAGGLTLWVMIYGLAVVRGAVHTPVNDFVWRVTKISLIVSIGAAGGIFQSETYGFYNEISNAIFNAINVGGGGACPVPANDPLGIYGALDCAAGQMFTPLMDVVYKIKSLIAPSDADLLTIMGNLFKVVVSAFVCFVMLIVAFLGTILLVIYMGFEVIALRVTLSLALSLSPLFIFALAFEPIKSLFTNWLNVVIKSIIFQALFVAFMGVAFGAVSNLLTSMLTVSATSDLGVMLVSIIVNLISFIIMIGILGFCATRIPHLASELSGGGAGGAGLGTILAAQAAGGLGKLKGRGKKEGGTVTGNS